MAVILPNPHLNDIGPDNDDILHHFGLSRKLDDLPGLFGNVKFVCIGGTACRMLRCIEYLTDVLSLPQPPNGGFVDHGASAGRFVLYVNGPILCASHGMGFGSLGIQINEVLKLLHYAGCSDVRMIRIGTCGGIGLEPGTVIVSKSCVDGLLRPLYETMILGRRVERQAVLDAELCSELLQCGYDDDGFEIVSGITVSTADFYEGQGRIDGAFCEHSLDDKMKYLHSLRDKGVVNFEMEGVLMASVCHQANVKGAVVCVSLLDRLQGDQVTKHDEMKKFEQRPLTIVGRYIRKCINNTKT